jgi:voltage-gated potassium channel
MTSGLLPLRRQFLPIAVVIFLVVSVGVAGYMIIEGWSFLDSLYMTAITLTTVGFAEVRPLSPGGRLFTIVLIVMGVGTIVYGLTASAEYLLAADLGPRLRSRRWRSIVKKLENHVIICGYGRVGRSAVSALRDIGEDVLIVERDESVGDIAREDGFLVVYGDAAKDETLKSAGIERAKGLISCLGDDAQNLFIVLSARTMNPGLKIVSRNVDPENEAKLTRAGADRVISPYLLGGRYMANVLTRPRVTEFLGSVTLDSGLELWLEEMIVAPHSGLAGQTVGQCNIRHRTGASLVGLFRKASGEMISPDKSTQLLADDVLIVLGTRDQLAQLAELADRSQVD